jgi:ferredoxin/flavodoxin---NADP+ reductase
VGELLTVTEVEHYTDRLFRIRTERPLTYRFAAGEFTMIGLPDSAVSRAYSFTSGPGDDYLEFYSIKVPNGPLTSRLQHVKPW